MTGAEYLSCRQDRALSRYDKATKASIPPGDLVPCAAESMARELVAPYLDIPNDQLNDFLAGKLGRESFRPVVIEGGKDD